MSTRKAQIARRVAIMLSWIISFGGSLFAVVTDVPQIIVIALFFGGMLPYIISIQFVEPWLEKREE